MRLLNILLGGLIASMVVPPPAAATQPDSRLGSSFAIVAQPTTGDVNQVARPDTAFFKIDVRPAAAVTLDESIPAEVAAQFGAKADVPFDVGRHLYGWPERPGLYCDLLRPRGLGLSAACLEDADQDGKFEEGLRLDFNSERADILVITPSGKVIGARFSKARLRLPRLVGYSPAQDSAQPTGKLALRWKRGPKKGPPIGLLWLSTPDNYTGTDGLSENVLAFDTDKLPMDVELYGLSIRILGFDEKGGLRYSVLGMKDGTAVPLVFRGDVFHIIGY